ncbi:Ndufs4, NADH dehydrogenase Fe-S protein 4 [Chiua virens]|nr:Ndufs4, NADH dehydrogenase Fe-S protein 4 [Chiua virens]
MSLLRACRARPTLNALAYIRSILTDAPTQTRLTPQKSESTQIAEPVHGEVFTADVVSGAPGELRHRAVRIYQPTRNTMQSGSGKTERWRIDWDILQGAGRWENPLMGFASSADYMQGTRISFKSKEDAIHFAEKQGIQPETVKRIPSKNYSENYAYKPHKLRIMRTK